MIKFNFFYSIPFWLSFVVIAIGIRLFDSRPKFRAVLLFFFSTFMILSIPKFNVWEYLILLAVAALTYGAGHFLNASPATTAVRVRRLVAFIGIAAVLLFLAFFKYRPLQYLFVRNGSKSGNAGQSFIFLIGVSYFSFKMIHFIIEAYRRKLEGLSAFTYINYILFFASFISGPIGRYNPFASQFNAPASTKISRDLNLGLERIIKGLFKKFVLVQLLMPHIFLGPTSSQPQVRIISMLIGLYAYALYFYFDFSGYTDLAVGSAQILGLGLPENFNRPFFRKNIRELWMNWHMSLTSWLVDYIYWPVVRKLRNLSYFRRHPISLSNIGIIITFIACGMWHGEALNFILWGAYHGLGISMVNIYQRGKRNIQSPFFQRYYASRTSHILGTIATFNFFALGLLLFVLNTHQLLDVIKTIRF